ncbi:hypothetical protein [Rhodococcoides yunnanense]|uniref:hypothetical protein n=1 Tax=Rhodococcoides yunnanense TaxID=278209 RepID=UPI0011149255|nr:hypothetical protein [Rhodococcus yunnanensis]
MDRFHSTQSRFSGIQGHSTASTGGSPIVGTDGGPTMSTEAIKAHLAKMFEEPPDPDAPLPARW